MKAVFVYRLAFRSFGKRSYIRKPLLILNPSFMSIGNGVSIREGARLEVVFSNPNRVPDLTIGDGTNIEQNVHIVCHSRVHIGGSVSITGNCSIVDVTHSYDEVHNPVKIGARIKDEDSFVEIGDGAFLGFGAVVLPNVRIGAHSVVGANSVVTHDIPDYSVAAGIPATVLKRFNFSKQVWEKVGTPLEFEVRE